MAVTVSFAGLQPAGTAALRDGAFPVRRVIESMITRGEQVSIVYRDEGDRGVWKLVRENGVWKIGAL